MLNVFAHTGSLSVAAARAGARTLSLDLSPRYLDWARENLVANGLDPADHDFIYGDALDWMGRFARRGRTFDVVLVDPPSSSTGRKGRGRWRVERDLHTVVERGAGLCRPGGTLFVSTNLRRMRWPVFLDQVAQGLAAAGRTGSVETQTVPLDHRSGPGDPPYLKSAWIQLDVGGSPSRMIARPGTSVDTLTSGISLLGRRAPEADLVSALIDLDDHGSPVAVDDLLSNLQLLMSAGFETTAFTIGNASQALTDHPEQLDYLRSHLGATRQAAEELLRFDAIVFPNLPGAAADVDVAGITIPEGTVVVVLPGAANRDPDHLGEPERLDLRREDAQSLSFGSGDPPRSSSAELRVRSMRDRSTTPSPTKAESCRLS